MTGGNPSAKSLKVEKEEAKRKEKEGEPAEPMPEARICDVCGMYNEADALALLHWALANRMMGDG